MFWAVVTCIKSEMNQTHLLDPFIRWLNQADMINTMACRVKHEVNLSQTHILGPTRLCRTKLIWHTSQIGKVEPGIGQ